jgi:PTS system nitrogen regulatory IIA component
MNLKKVLSKESICMDLKSGTKEEVIEEMVDVLISSGALEAGKKVDVLDCIMKREQQMSTGMQEGIAIPHGKSSDVSELLACIGISREGVDFKALDGKKSTIFVMTLSPVGKTGPHVQFLAEISSLLTNADKRKQILSASSEEEILSIFTGK